MQRVPIVYGKTNTAESLVRGLSAEGIPVRWAASGDDALASLHTQPQDVVVLDWMLPGTSGVDVLRALGSQGQRVPALLLTAPVAVSDRANGLEAGDDDYRTKPFAPAELLARVRALVRRATPIGAPKPARRPFAWARAMAVLPGFLGTLAAPLAADDVATAANGSAPWSIHTQATWIDQEHPAFDSPYEGPNSLTGASQAERTFSISLFLGYRIRAGTELYFDPEIFQGHGLSNTLGMAGFPNGEAVKAAFFNLHYNTSRLYVRQTFGLGGETEKVADGQQNVAGSYDVNRITLTVGKFSSQDLFDDNAYSHDTRSQFMNWALWESAAWDYPADVVGFTAGFVAEWNTKDWALRYGIFMEPTVTNGSRLDYHLLDAHGQVLQFDRRYSIGDLAGTLRPFVYWNQAHMGNYSDAVASPDISDALSQSRAYRSKVGFGMSWDQQLTQDLGVFVRLSWDDGRSESFAFTEIDRSLAAGLSVGGARWGRKSDTLGIAGVVNGIAPSHRAYLEAGGTEGLILGDGRLNYGQEEILETYYSVQAAKWLWISPDFQYATHPGYNRDRGPVPIYALRVHVEF
ncbi:MAG TPA: carbohydrate porin [Opitutaceae bacterium]|nr:carbohydrate porin [Opitutaceae bacterium]